MPFNGPVEGDYSVCDPNEAPWTNEIATLTHEECVQVITKVKEIEEGFKPEEHDGNPPSDMLIHSDYNKSDWQYAINIETYNLLKQYDPEVNKEGITEFGIVGTYEQPTESPAE